MAQWPMLEVGPLRTLIGSDRVELRMAEHRLLWILACRNGRTVRWAAIQRHMWPGEILVDRGALYTHLARVRTALRIGLMLWGIHGVPLSTVRDVGLRLAWPEDRLAVAGDDDAD